jgi:hypothetical protein
MRLAALRGNFAQAVEYLDAESGNALEAFQWDVLELAIAFDQVPGLLEQMSDRESLLRALAPRVGLNMKYQIEEHFGNHREAASIALDLFSKSPDAKVALSYLDAAMSSLCFINQRTDEDAALSQGIMLQKRYYKVKGIGGVPMISLFESDSCRMNVSLWLLLADEFCLASDIISYYGLSRAELGGQILDVVINDGREAFLTFIAKLEAGWEALLFQEVLYEMALRIVFCYRQPDLLIQTTRVLRGPEFRAKLLIQFGLVDEASRAIFERNLTGLVPLLGNVAQLRGKVEIVAKCTKILESAMPCK